MKKISIARQHSRTISRRSLVRGLAAASAALSPLEALAQAAACAGLRGRSIRWIVASPPGGGYDMYSRLLAPHLERTMGVEIRVDNVVGASGVRGARTLRDAAPDGRTVGILNAPALMMASLSDDAVPNPAEDFTILGRIARSLHVWATGASSGIRTIEDIFDIAGSRGIVFGTTTANSLSFAEPAITCSLLGMRADFVTGYPGSRYASLAAIRGEVDLVAFSSDSILDRLQAGDLRPLLQISGEPIPELPSPDGVPCLAGPNGLARRRAAASDRDPLEIETKAAGLVEFTGAGRIIAAPRGLAPELRDCLIHGVCATLAALPPSRLDRQIDTACAEESRVGLTASRKSAQDLWPIVQEAQKRARGARL